MEIILIFMTFFITQYILYRELIKISENLDFISKHQNVIDNQLYAIINRLQDIEIGFSEHRRTLLNFVDHLEATKTPIKPNNFDSLKEAFKGPTRVNRNERN